MSEDPKVQMVSKKSLAKQWMNGLFHHGKACGKHIPKKAVPLLWVLAGISSAIPIASQYAKKDFSIPDTNTSSSTIKTVTFEIPNVEAANSSKEKNVKNYRPPKTATFHAAVVIERPHLGNIPPGSLISGRLITGASDGPIKAVSTEPLMVDGEVVVKEGTVFVGSGRSTEERLDIIFKSMVHSDGKSEQIRARAADFSDKIAGLKGSKVGAYAGKLAAATGLNVLSGYAEGMKKKEVKDGQVIDKADPENALLNGASYAAIDLSREILSNMKNKAPRIEVPSGTEIFILFEGTNGKN